MLDEAAREDLIEQITALFTNEASAGEFNEDPDAYVDEHLPEGTEAADISGCLPEVAERTGLDFSNVASTGGGASAAGQLSHTYQTIYQQNSFIYAEEGSQVTNIQGDGNAVAQQDVDVDIDVDYGEGEEPPTEEPTEEPTETPIEMTEEAPPEAPAEEPGDPGIDYGGMAPPDEFEQPNLVADEAPAEVEEAPEPPPEPEPIEG